MNEYSDTKIRSIKNLIDELCPPWAEGPTLELSDVAGDQFLDLPFTSEELDFAIANLRLKSSPGLDGIDYQILSQLPQEGRVLLLDLYNQIYSSRTFPEDWRKYSIFFIPKAEREKFRPISLAPCICKIMEKILNNRIMWWLEFNGKLPESQNGFRKGRSCADNLAILCSSIIKGFKKGEITAALFLDIKAAYANVLSEPLIEKMKTLGFPINLVTFVYNLVSKRYLNFQFGKISESRVIFRGLPQGSVLSPILYAIYVLDLDNVVQIDRSCMLLQYADDACITVQNKDTSSAIEVLEGVTGGVLGVLDRLGLDLSVSKTKLCIFSKNNIALQNREGNRRVKGKRKWKFRIAGSMIESCEDVRFLGVQLQSSLKWNLQIDRIDKVCRNSLKTISCLRRTWWGADPTILLRIYRALIRSRIEYGGLFFHNLTKSEQLKLDRIQYKSLREILGYTGSTPTSVILTEAKEPPLEVRFKYLLRNFLSRAITRRKHNILGILEELVALEDNPVIINREGNVNLINCFRDIDSISHVIKSSDSPICYDYGLETIWFHPNVSFKEGEEIKNSNINDCQGLFRDIFNEYLRGGWTCYFTDGSKDKFAPFGGFAVVQPEDQQELAFRAPKYASIFTLEAMAIVETLKMIYRANFKCSAIFSDSRSVLQALITDSNLNKKSYLVFLIRKLIKKLADQRKRVQLFWIPSHCGISGNELADNVAKNAIYSGKDTSLLLPGSDFKGLWKERINNEFKYWFVEISRDKGFTFQKNIGFGGVKPWFDKMKLNRRAIVSINRLRSGHTSLKSSLARFGIVQSALCECGETDETPDHVFFQCSRFDAQRVDFLKVLTKTIGMGPYSIETLLNFPSHDLIRIFAKFIVSLDIFI
ncbi:uncharacterized protein LOC123269675 [Cotesia glomerata]|uniref:uncharacterized protein LOC123269675 n=1 Tax=Cotesia glomerata TaxID=32391 RepID=UPI001D00C7FE|nr:uncharacterized protein LOC123269675 [Cotesia glomerata]